ncbi:MULTISPECIES: hypothetical protein [unclassified Roseofilum]|uniref:hypothetical protein n=1 Tax=unclassified Roseofilum TaxID=2620099 RepID=UPI000E7EA18E|nr:MULTISPECIES: hypothetical protein [unclassified Roseofilum]MBP0009947.1 hypothetical protein [Roseofilum sp. Belize Diploria]MBP0034071.1 hypothetical protein [Roseofilum sp. Belize BBD 4]HBQ99272.1 hypothetical protein [Cyanobacteria bacterium UBA11691]
MKSYPLVTCHINPRSRIESKALSESGLEVGSPEFVDWALKHKKFKVQVSWEPFNYSVVYRITCYLRSDQLWYASKCIGGIFKQHRLGKTEEITTAKLIEAVQWLCPDPQAIAPNLPPESEDTIDPAPQTEKRKFNQALYYQLLLEIEDLKQQIEELLQNNQNLKIDREQLWQQHAQSVKLRQDLQEIVTQLMAEREQYEEQLQTLNQVVNELGKKLESVNLKTNPRWYYADRYYQKLQEALQGKSL